MASLRIVAVFLVAEQDGIVVEVPTAHVADVLAAIALSRFLLEEFAFVWSLELHEREKNQRATKAQTRRNRMPQNMITLAADSVKYMSLDYASQLSGATRWT